MVLEALIRRIPEELLKTPIAVLMGGSSPEREISLRSGHRVAEALQRLSFDVVKVDVGKNLAEDLTRHKIRLVFLAVHGVPGEDGSLQGTLDSMGISYTGASVAGSALAINKLASKATLEKWGVQTPEYIPIDVDQPVENLVHQLAESLGFPMVLKPTFGGSSLGIRMATDLSELRTSLDWLIPRYEHLYAERYIAGREITLSILEDSRKKTYSLPILELKPRNLFYDFECKVKDGKADFIIPAELPETLAQRAVETALISHRRLMMRDFSRSDFIVSEQGELYYMETNSIPGLTELSDLPAQARANGMIFEELIFAILIHAYQRMKKGES